MGGFTVGDALVARGVVEHVDLGFFFFLILVFTMLYSPEWDSGSSQGKVRSRAGGSG